MSWIALVLTLLLEQLHATPAGNPVYVGAAAWADRVALNMNAGRQRHGVYGWLLVAGVAVAATLLVYVLLRSLGWVFALGFDVLVLFFAMGFRQFSHPLTAIQRALENGDSLEARRAFIAWRQSVDPGFDPTEISDAEVARQAIEFGVLAAHRHVFGVVFWFVVMPGPSGAVLYRFAEYLARHWNRVPSGAEAGMAPDRFGWFAREAYAWLDWLPARLTALAFAIVGDFEGAMHCWRNLNFDPWPSVENARTLIAATAGGAIGVRVLSAADMARHVDPGFHEAGELAEPGAPAMRSAVGLAWRAMILWLLLLLLLLMAATIA